MMSLQRCQFEAHGEKFPSADNKSRNYSSSALFTGNIVPHSWFQKITSEAGKPDHIAISIFSEIVYWYRPNREGESKFEDDAWKTSYVHFEKKFGYNHQKIRRALVRLEKLNLIRRELRTIVKYGQRYNNVLFIHLIGFDHIGNHSTSANSSNENDKKICTVLYNFDAPSLQICRDHIEDKEINLEKRSRSEKSNFVKEFFCESENPHIELQADRKILENVLKPFKTKNLSDFYPITEDDKETLNTRSGREFNLNFINELLRKLSIKYPDYKFSRKESFMNYMVKAISNELLQASSANREGFKLIKTEEEKEEFQSKKKIENYLTAIEQSANKSTESQFKRKICAIFEPEIAYKVLSSTNFDVQNDKLVLKLRQNIPIDDWTKEILLREARGVYGGVLSQIEINNKIKCNSQALVINSSLEEESQSYIEEDLWQKVREKLREYYGLEIDKSWFSKLEATIDERNKKLNLYASTSFIGSWITSNFITQIAKFVRSMNYEVSLSYP